MKKILSCILVFSILLSMAVIDVAAISTPASLMGKYVKLGTFDDQDMVWYVAARDNVNDDAISDYYLIKADALMEAGIAVGANKSGSNMFNAWSNTYLRTYLNSSKPAGEVEYSEANKVAEGCGEPDANYKDRAGFLTNFTTAEQSIMLDVTHQSVITDWHIAWGGVEGAPEISDDTPNWQWAGDLYASADSEWFGKQVPYSFESSIGKKYRYLDYYANIDSTYKETTTDKIFIPGMTDALKYKLPLHDLTPVDTGVWLRDIGNGVKDYTFCVTNARFVRRNVDNYIGGDGCTEANEIRPCMFIDGSIKYNVTGDGTKKNPYTLVWEKACDDLVGKYVYLGEYGPSADEKYPIKWYIAGSKDVDNDGVEEYFLSASEIISLKSMSILDGYASNHQRMNSHQWVASPLRAWLNSDEASVSAYGKYVTYDKTNEETVYTSTRPTNNENTTAKVLAPAYSSEAGFMTNFTASEKALMKTVKHKSLITIGGYKESNIAGLGFTVKADDPNAATPNYGGNFNMLENAGNASSGVFNTVSNVIVPGTAANDIWQGVHTGRAADNEDEDYFWIDALTNINGARGNNFGAATFDSSAAYIESTDTIFVPSLFDVADFGGEMLYMHKERNNTNSGYQCGSAKPSDVNAGGFMWLRDIGISADNVNTAKFVLAYSPVVGPKNIDISSSESVGVQPAMYISSDIVTSGLGTYAEPLTVLTSETNDADGQVEISKDELTNKVTATAHIYNKTNAPKNFVVIIAKYVANEDGNLVLATANQDDAQLSNTDDPTTISASLDYEEGAVYKAFIWDNTSIYPYSQAKTY